MPSVPNPPTLSRETVPSWVKVLTAQQFDVPGPTTIRLRRRWHTRGIRKLASISVMPRATTSTPAMTSESQASSSFVTRRQWAVTSQAGLTACRYSFQASVFVLPTEPGRKGRRLRLVASTTSKSMITKRWKPVRTRQSSTAPFPPAPAASTRVRPMAPVSPSVKLAMPFCRSTSCSHMGFSVLSGILTPSSFLPLFPASCLPLFARNSLPAWIMRYRPAINPAIRSPKRPPCGIPLRGPQ